MLYCLSHAVPNELHPSCISLSHHLFAVICARAKLNMWRFYITAFNISALFTVLMSTYTACVNDLHSSGLWLCWEGCSMAYLNDFSSALKG